jgi:hypothetical protein
MRSHLFSRIFKSVAPCVLLISGGLAVTACTQSAGSGGEDETFEVEGDHYTFHGMGVAANLGHEERKLFESDQRYVRSLASEGRSVQLNHADERQHRFVMARLQLAGKTPENSPALFDMIEQARVKHVAEKVQPGKVYSTTSLLATDTRDNLHNIGSVNINSTTSMEVIAAGTVKDTIYYRYIDAAPWDKDGNQIGGMPYIETYGNTPYTSVQANGDLTLTAQDELVGDSLMIEDNALTGYTETYITQSTTRAAKFAAVTVAAPKDTVGNDNLITVCLSRGGGNCDHNLLGTLQVKLPLEGQVSITTMHKFDQAKINELKAGTAVDARGEPQSGGNITLTLKNAGGACRNKPVGSFSTSMQAFWNTVTLSPDQKTLFWKMNAPNALALFDSSCQLGQDNVELNMIAQLPYTNPAGNLPGQQAITITNNPLTGDPSMRIPNIKMTNSCLAAGTKIEMASGWLLPIEEIQMGDLVYSPYDLSDFSLRVADTITGTESTPMVRIEDEHGKSLLLTEKHPVDIVGRGMVMAKYLKAGDVVTTKEGPSRLVTVGREEYKGTVYNLKVGSGAELQSIGKDQTTVYANGFLVGDAQIQGDAESAELAASSQPAPLPARWRTDYQNSAKH